MVEGESILDVLFPEVVELALQESRRIDPKGFPDLRLVCKALNEFVGPKVFSTVKIQFEKDDLGKWKSIPDFVSWLASGTSPYSRWAKTLRVIHLVPHKYEENDDNPLASEDQWQKEDSEREMMLVHQKRHLVPAIDSLVHLECVRFVADSSQPYHDALHALTKLPRVRTLAIIFRGPPSGHIPLGEFSDLTTLSLVGATFTQQLVEGLRCLLAKSPSIAQLTLSARANVAGISVTEVETIDVVSLLNIESLQKDIEGHQKGPPSSSTLTDLCISAAHFKVSPSCVPFLRALTSLSIADESAHVQPSFWKSLQDCQIHLLSLTVGPLLQPAINYLLSYSGLRHFVLEHSYNIASRLRRHQYDENLAHQFFCSVLPMHRATIQTVVIRKVKPGTLAWPITRAYLEGVCQCKNLESFYTYNDFPLDEDSGQVSTITLADVLSTVSDNLPKLRKLGLLRPSMGRSDVNHALKEYIRLMFSNSVTSGRFQFSAKCRPQFSLRTVGSEFIPTPAGSECHYGLELLGRWDDVMDPLMSRAGDCLDN